MTDHLLNAFAWLARPVCPCGANWPSWSRKSLAGVSVRIAASFGGCHNTSHSVHRRVQPDSESIVRNHVAAFAGGFI
jgi:hypothetical protein